jgi:hypothetical protein
VLSCFQITKQFGPLTAVNALSFGFRAAGLLPAQALLPLTILVMLALSTHAQTLFGLEGDAGMTRYQLLPVPPWQILAAKDAPFLLLLLLLTLPLAPGAGPRRRSLGFGNRPSRFCDVHGSSRGPRYATSDAALFGWLCVVHLLVLPGNGATLPPVTTTLPPAWFNEPAVTVWRSGDRPLLPDASYPRCWFRLYIARQDRFGES